jgi:hypothetical protein
MSQVVAEHSLETEIPQSIEEERSTTLKREGK